MITAFAQHLVSRYGLDEVATWKFEVWNEPNLDFWVGEPKQSTYFELYDHTARAIKSVSPRLQVGGPSTAQAAWVTPFLQHVKDADVPIDFVSTHVYANDTAHDVFGTNEQIPRDQMVYRSVKKVHDEIASSPFPKSPAHLLRVQRQLRQRAQRHRHRLHGALAREHHSPVRRPGKQHGVLVFLRRV